MGAAIKIYTTEYCGYCVRGKQLFDRKGAEYEEIDVTNRPDLRKSLMTAANQRTVPQIFINGRPQGGFVDIAALERKGELDRLLATEPSPDDPPVKL